MQQFFSLIEIDKAGKQPVYLQLANQLLTLIRNGSLRPGEKLPPTRQLALQLKVNRQTIVKGFDELVLQGWLQSKTGSGTFVAHHLPQVKPPTSLAAPPAKKASLVAGFSFNEAPHLQREATPNTTFHLDDGFPDARLAPLEQLSRAYRSQLLMGNRYTRLSYNDPKGTLWLRQQLITYLHETRGFNITHENILITRGTTMALYLACTALLKKGDTVAVAEVNWRGGNMNFVHAGAKLVTIPVDEYGLDVEALKKICTTQKVRMLYITSHHQYPTTVALSANRRVELLTLAEKYGFIIFEDDYDYDFHYLSKPLLPLAAADSAGMALYAGSFTKAVSPAFRVGYLVAPENVINHLALFRRVIDRQGDTMLENAFAELLQNGTLQRHLRKSLRVYWERRDFFCKLLQEKLSAHISFQVPDGGMAIWAKFNDGINLSSLAARALKRDLYFYDGAGYFLTASRINATRLGFASSTPGELGQCVGILQELLGKKA